jgi:hypothetical protein
MGPTHDNMTDIEREENFNTYIEDFFRPWYKSVEGSEEFTEYQVDLAVVAPVRCMLMSWGNIDLVLRKI